MPDGQQTVLIIDDAPEDRVALRRYLTLGLASPYRVLEASLGSEGLRLWRDERPDCVLLDYYLPDKDGLALLVEMMAESSSSAVPVVMLTVSNDASLAIRAVTTGAQDYLVKDRLTADDLRRAVVNAIERVRLYRERFHAVTALREHEERLRLALAAGDLGTWEWSPESDSVTADERLLALFGLTPATFDGTAAVLLGSIHPDDRPDVGRALRRAATERRHYEAEFRVVDADGSVRWLRGIGHPQQDEAGAVVRVVGFNEEITERKRSEVERSDLLAREQAARRAAEDALRLRESFLAVASHELKTPLTSMLGNLYLLQRRLVRAGALGERDERLVQVVEAQGNRLKRMVNTMLDVSALQAGDLRIERTELDLARVVRQVVADALLTLGGHTLTLHAPDHPLPVRGDSERLSGVVHALLDNALKYSPLGGQVDVRAERDGVLALISISDRGVGIAADLLPRLMQPFARATEDHRHFSGMGVGLYLSRAIIMLHGGTLMLASEEGVGSTVTVRLPIDDPPAGVTPADSRASGW